MYANGNVARKGYRVLTERQNMFKINKKPMAYRPILVIMIGFIVTHAGFNSLYSMDLSPTEERNLNLARMGFAQSAIRSLSPELSLDEAIDRLTEEPEEIVSTSTQSAGGMNLPNQQQQTIALAAFKQLKDAQQTARNKKIIEFNLFDALNDVDSSKFAILVTNYVGTYNDLATITTDEDNLQYSLIQIALYQQKNAQGELKRMQAHLQNKNDQVIKKTKHLEFWQNKKKEATERNQSRNLQTAEATIKEAQKELLDAQQNLNLAKQQEAAAQKTLDATQAIVQTLNNQGIVISSTDNGSVERLIARDSAKKSLWSNISQINKDILNGANKGEPDTIEQGLDKGANINAQDSNGQTALMAAARNGHMNVVQFLLEKNADLFVKDNSAATVLRHAINSPENGIYKIIELLLNKMGSIKAIVYINAVDNKKNRTALQWLLRRHPNAFGKNLSLLSAKSIHTIAQLLIDSWGANPLIVDSTGENALYWASNVNDLDLIRILMNKITLDENSAVTLCRALVKGSLRSLQITDYNVLKARLLEIKKLIEQRPRVPGSQAFNIQAIMADVIGNVTQQVFEDSIIQNAKNFSDYLISDLLLASTAQAMPQTTAAQPTQTTLSTQQSVIPAIEPIRCPITPVQQPRSTEERQAVEAQQRPTEEHISELNQKVQTASDRLEKMKTHYQHTLGEIDRMKSHLSHVKAKAEENISKAQGNAKKQAQERERKNIEQAQNQLDTANAKASEAKRKLEQAQNEFNQAQSELRSAQKIYEYGDWFGS